MDNSVQGMLVGSEIHGFHTLNDLDVGNIKDEAKIRWLRPNEIHAILCNHKYFSIHVKPVNLPTGGTMVLFDRKMLRNFRKDGHNWKKKKDGKTVKEAHEHLKVGNEERIHVYYAHGQDTPTFVRRCYWLLDKSLEHIVLVHYRETQEGSPATPVASNSSSLSDHSNPWRLSEELDSGTNQALYVGENELLEPGNKLTVKHYEQKLHEINTLDWDELLVTDDLSNTPNGGGNVLGFVQQNQVRAIDSIIGGSNTLSEEISTFDNGSGSVGRNDTSHFGLPDSSCTSTMVNQLNSNTQGGNSIVMASNDSLDIMVNGLQSQDSFGRWINDIISDSSGSVDDPVFGSSELPHYDEFTSAEINHHQSSVPQQIFSITDLSPAWAFTTERTKILITGFFHEEFAHMSKSGLLCVCGDVCIPTEVVQLGVYRCMVPPHPPGCVNIYLSLDGHKPISQVLNFEYRSQLLHGSEVSLEEKDKWDDFQVQMRLLGLLFSTSKSLNILSSKVSPTALKVAKNFAQKTSNIANSWGYLQKSIQDNKISFPLAKDGLLELILRNRIREWLLERIVEGSKKSTEFDSHGQGVIHLCAILGYSWAIHLFVWSGLTLDFRDKSGWTALHWAAYCGREKMVAVLLYAGAKPNLVTDPTSENPGGCTAADLASLKGHDGLAAYLSEKALVAHFEEMSIAGNISGTLQTSTTESETINSENLSEEELYLKDSLAAYRTAADAAARINAAFREHSYKQRTKEVQVSTPEIEARNIIAAMKIQHAFRNFEMRRKMTAAAHIQHRFRTWKLRKAFLNMRRQAIKIQAAFRGFKVRRHYTKIIWSVGVLEKAILRWRLKRKGFRGLQVEPVEPIAEPRHESDTEEDFYRTSQKQASERVERAVVRVQALFRSKKAQEDYQRMKMAHLEASLEYDEVFDFDSDMRG